MTKFKMRVFDQLEQHERHVKQAVWAQIEQPQRPEPNRTPIYILASLLITIIFIVSAKLMPFQNVTSTNDGEIIVGNIENVKFHVRTPYYVALPLTWTGAEAVNVFTYDMFDSEGNSTRYEKHGFAMQVFDVDDSVKPGIYERHEINEIEDFENTLLEPNKENIIVFEVIFAEHFDYHQDYSIKLVYDQNKQQVADWTLFKNISVYPLDTKDFISQLAFTEEEVAAYEAFKASKKRAVLTHLQPMSVMKLFYATIIDGEKALQYELYTKNLEQIAWSYDEMLEFSPFHQLIPEEAVKFATLYMQGEFKVGRNNEGHVESKDGSRPIYFSMIKDEDMWAVSFLPIQ